MKRFIIAVVLCAAASISSDTLRAGNFGVVGGASFLGIKGADSEMSTGYHAGLTYKFGLPSGFAIQPSLLYHVKASASGPKVADAAFKAGYVELPVSFQWGPDLLLFRPFVDVSPFIGYGFTHDMASRDWESLKKLEYGLGLGAGLEVWKLQIVCRYNWNFGPILNQDDYVNFDIIPDAGFGKNNFRGVTLSLALLF